MYLYYNLLARYFVKRTVLLKCVMEKLFRGRRNCGLVVIFSIVLIMLVYYTVQRRINVTVGDYKLPKKHIEVMSEDEELKQIRLKEEERIGEIEIKTTTRKPLPTTVKLIQVKTERQPFTENKQKEKPTYVQSKSNVSRNNIIWVYSDGALTLTNRVINYVNKIEEVRSDLKLAHTQVQWIDVQESLKVLWCNQDDYLKSVGMFKQVRTIALSWHPWKIDSSMKWTSLGDVSNLQIQKYYEWSGAERLCKMIRGPGYTKARWDAVYRQHCNTNPLETEKSKSMEFVYFWGKPINKDHYWPNDGYRYPSYFYEAVPMFIFHMFIIENTVITALGDVISDDLKLVPYSCSQDLDPKPPPKYKASMLYDEVFIMTQYWGENFFHKMLENFPRIIPYVDFLKRHTEIKIHAADSGGYTSFLFEVLGIDPSRLIKGVVRSNLVFLPQATPCGFPHVQNTQLFSAKLREEIGKMSPQLQRNSVVLIQRSGSRRFTKAREIHRDLQQLAHTFNRTFRLFADNPTPSPRESMTIFNEAVLVVGPHGAGLSNLLYCEPGTFVIEGVCNPPHVNMCYQRTAHILGHHYHAIDSSGGCEDVIDIEPGEIIKVAEVFLSIASRKL